MIEASPNLPSVATSISIKEEIKQEAINLPKNTFYSAKKAPMFDDNLVKDAPIFDDDLKEDSSIFGDDLVEDTSMFGDDLKEDSPMFDDDLDEDEEFLPEPQAKRKPIQEQSALFNRSGPSTEDFVPIPVSDKGRLSREFIYEGERDESLAYPCEICLWGTDNINYFKEHQLRHKYSTEENLLFYFCPLCEAGYQEWTSLNRHR